MSARGMTGAVTTQRLARGLRAGLGVAALARMWQVPRARVMAVAVRLPVTSAHAFAERWRAGVSPSALAVEYGVRPATVRRWARRLRLRRFASGPRRGLPT